VRSEASVAEPATGAIRGHLVLRTAGWVVLVALLALQLWALYVAGGTGGPLFPHSDKAGHLTMFAAPAALAVLLRSRSVLALLLVHALVAEPVQGWLTETRVTDTWDAVANLTGLALGTLVALRWGRSR
jgi:hypothetical protein